MQRDRKVKEEAEINTRRKQNTNKLTIQKETNRRGK